MTLDEQITKLNKKMDEIRIEDGWKQLREYHKLFVEVCKLRDESNERMRRSRNATSWTEEEIGKN